MYIPRLYFSIATVERIHAHNVGHNCGQNFLVGLTDLASVFVCVCVW